MSGERWLSAVSGQLKWRVRFDSHMWCDELSAKRMGLLVFMTCCDYRQMWKRRSWLNSDKKINFYCNPINNYHASVNGRFPSEEWHQIETTPSTIDKWPIVACPQRVWINQKEENPSIIDLVRMGLPCCHGCRQPTMGTKDPIQLYNCFCLANQNSVSRWQGADSFPPSLGIRLHFSLGTLRSLHTKCEKPKER